MLHIAEVGDGIPAVLRLRPHVQHVSGLDPHEVGRPALLGVCGLRLWLPFARGLVQPLHGPALGSAELDSAVVGKDEHNAVPKASLEGLGAPCREVISLMIYIFCPLLEGFSGILAQRDVALENLTAHVFDGALERVQQGGAGKARLIGLGALAVPALDVFLASKAHTFCACVKVVADFHSLALGQKLRRHGVHGSGDLAGGRCGNVHGGAPFCAHQRRVEVVETEVPLRAQEKSRTMK